MQTLGQNMQKIHYALYVGLTDKIDAGGYKTGEKVKTYGNPVEMLINVSASRGTAETEQFGITAEYNNTMVTHDMNCPISEDTILWVNASTSLPHDYKVEKVAKGLNTILYAIKKVR